MFVKWFREYLRDRRRRKVWGEAYDLAGDGKHAEAAGVYARLAAQMLQDGEPSWHTIYCHEAFQSWLKAKNPECALQEARQALGALSDACRRFSDSRRFSLSSSVEQLSAMVGELYMAGYAAEADTFLREVNEQLAANGLPHIPAAGGGGKLPTTCPQCGGSLSPLRGDDKVPCTSCGCVVRAV